MDTHKTIFLDIDGTILRHYGSQEIQAFDKPEVLPGVYAKLHAWEKAGHHIILTTARKSGLRKVTEKQLIEARIIYDELIMGISSGVRVVINDAKTDSNEPTAMAITVPKNEGIEHIDI